MTRRKEWTLSAALVLSAAIAVAVYALRVDDALAKRNSVQIASSSSDDNGSVTLGVRDAGRIGVTYATAEFGPMLSRIRTVGQVAYDESRVTAVNPRIEGWVDQLFVNFTGAAVRKGQPLLSIYSPMLVAAQEELILARRLFDQAATPETQANAQSLLSAARQRLSYWNVAGDDIARIEQGHIQKAITLAAPASGLVLEKNVVAGARVMPGMDLYRIVDLSSVWIEGDVFEKDLALITVGRTARVTLEAYPDRALQARVTYVYPTMTAASRTGRIRLELSNRELLLKPGMYATLEFDVPVHQDGVHVPRSAVLQTGERTIVFVRAADGRLVPRPVSIGFATTDHVEILSGLNAGEVVVASANFLIDAESNLGGALQQLPSDGKQPPAAHKH